MSLTGAVDGENVSLTCSSLLGLQSTTLSGTLTGDTLTLTGAEAQPIVLKRSSFNAYQAQISALGMRSQSIISAKAAALRHDQAEKEAQKLVSNIDVVINNMQRFESESDMHLGRFANVEKAYKAITAKMSEDFVRERQVSSSPSASIARSQLVVNATQVSFGTEQLHDNQESLQSSLQSSIGTIRDELNTLEQRCNDTATGDLSQTEVQSRKAACSRLQSAIPALWQKYNAVIAGLAQLEQVYKQEREKQNALLKSAQKIE